MKREASGIMRPSASFKSRDLSVLLANVSVVLDLRLDRINDARRDNFTQGALLPIRRDIAQMAFRSSEPLRRGRPISESI